MCNDYAREIENARVIAAMKEMEDVPPFSYTGGRIPNDDLPTPHIKIRERGFVVRLRDDDMGLAPRENAGLQLRVGRAGFLQDGPLPHTVNKFLRIYKPEERKPK